MRSKPDPYRALFDQWFLKAFATLPSSLRDIESVHLDSSWHDRLDGADDAELIELLLEILRRLQRTSSGER